MQVQISFDKCQVLTVNDGQHVHDRFYEISNAQFVKDLRFIIDRKFLFDEHCLRVVKKISHLINFIFAEFIYMLCPSYA